MVGGVLAIVGGLGGAIYTACFCGLADAGVGQSKMGANMKRWLMCAMGLCLCASLWAQPLETQTYRLSAPSNGRTYQIQVAAVGQPPAHGYPVLYVLDGHATFSLAVSAAQNQWRDNAAQATPLLIVGVAHTDHNILDLAARAEDFTPPSADYRQTGDRLHTRFGGATAFHHFLSQSLRQKLLQDGWRINPQQHNLFGHSYGGLFTLYSMMKHTGDFRHYLIASPSIWWNQRRVLAEWPTFRAVMTRTGAPSIGVRLTVGEYEQTLAPHLPPQPERQQQLQQRGMVREAQQLGSQLAQLPAERLQVQTAVYPAQTHASVLVPAVHDGIKWLMAQCRADESCSGL